MSSGKFYSLAAGVGVIVIGAVIALILMISKVDNGHVGVVYSINGGVQNDALGQGWHLVSPTERVIEYPVRTQTKDYENMSAATVDGKSVAMTTLSINYHIDPERAAEVYKKFGSASIESLENGFIKTRVNDALRQTVSNYTVIETFGEKAGEIKNQTLEVAIEDLGNSGIIIEDIFISAPQPDEQTQSAIDDRVTASQELERAEIDLEKAEKEAERREVEAQGEAEANEIIENSLSEDILQQQLIDKWTGEYPISIGSDGVIVDLPQDQTVEEDE